MDVQSFPNLLGIAVGLAIRRPNAASAAMPSSATPSAVSAVSASRMVAASSQVQGRSAGVDAASIAVPAKKTFRAISSSCSG